MNKNILLALMLASLLTACNKAADRNSSAAASPSINDQMEEKAKKTIANSLKDPGSAQFRNIRESSPGILCGEVNAKNSMGGYVGFKRFTWHIAAPGFVDFLSDTDGRCK